VKFDGKAEKSRALWLQLGSGELGAVLHLEVLDSLQQLLKACTHGGQCGVKERRHVSGESHF